MLDRKDGFVPVACGAASEQASFGSVDCRVVRVTYLRPDGLCQGWGLHVWGDGVIQETAWEEPMPPTGQVSGGSFWDVPVQASGAVQLGVIVHMNDSKSAGGDLISLAQDQSSVWLVEGFTTPMLSEAEAVNSLAGSLSTSSAHWVDAQHVLWRDARRLPDASFALVGSRGAELELHGGKLRGGTWRVDLDVVPEAPGDLAPQFPHLADCAALRLRDLDAYNVTLDDLVTSQLAVVAMGVGDSVLRMTGVQVQGVLDDRYFYEGPLGPSAGQVTVWAPTAQVVELLHFTGVRDESPTQHTMQRDACGAWSLPVPGGWSNQLYKYSVTAYHPSTQQIHTTTVTDPYSRGLTADGRHSMFVDLQEDAHLKPAGWDGHEAPALAGFNDISLYELHIRDFSASDSSVPQSLRGKYVAFCESETGGQTAGQAHLASLAQAGLTHVHLLPTYDYGSVPEREEDQLTIEQDLSVFPPDSPEQQALVMRVASEDAYNWGYDPVHYGVPEGSYATDPDHPSRLLQFRQMVQALHQMGLRVVLDVVYNHTFASGLDRYSVLDKVVPGYYHRRDENGMVCNSTCCNNVATEHRMAERLMVEDLVHWAVDFRVDGFRFDIMGHIMMSSMERVRSALDGLSLESHGVDGSKICLYGEAWDFGEVAGNQRGRNACQLNVAGSGIGTFNDRVRDGALGGSPFGDPSDQGFLTGVVLNPNGRAPTTGLSTLLYYKNLVRLSMAGNLRDFEVMDPDSGEAVQGKRIPFGASIAAYCKRPSENVVYLGCHDNETLYDNVVLKANHGGSAEHCARVVQLALGVVAVSQGMPFFHAGDELLRSKSLDRDSYNSGDWFNRLLWGGEHNNFGVGLPPASKNASTWKLKRQLLAEPGLVASSSLIQQTREFFLAMLRLRASSPAFRLPTAADIIERVAFPEEEGCHPGVLVMTIAPTPAAASSDGEETVVVMLNVSAEQQPVPFPSQLTGLRVHTHMADLEHVRGCDVNQSTRTVSLEPCTFVVLCADAV